MLDQLATNSFEPYWHLKPFVIHKTCLGLGKKKEPYLQSEEQETEEKWKKDVKKIHNKPSDPYNHQGQPELPISDPQRKQEYVNAELKVRKQHTKSTDQ